MELLQDKKRSNNIAGDQVEVKSSFDLLEETLQKTNLGNLKKDQLVNLERSLLKHQAAKQSCLLKKGF